MYTIYCTVADETGLGFKKVHVECPDIHAARVVWDTINTGDSRWIWVDCQRP